MEKIVHNNNFRIIIIDDNVSIHDDFIKILTPQKTNIALKSLGALKKIEHKLFSKEHVDSPKVQNLPNFTIDTATQGLEGLEKIKQAVDDAKPYTIAFVDVRMPPGLDGVQTIKKIHAIDPDIQIVMCTAYSDYSWDETVNEIGENVDFLILKKPFDIDAVKQLAFSLTRKWINRLDTKHKDSILKNKFLIKSNKLNIVISEMKSIIDALKDGVMTVDKLNNVINCNDNFKILWPAITEINNIYCILPYLKNPEPFSDLINNLKPQEIATNLIELTNGKTYESYTRPNIHNDKVIGRIWCFRDISSLVSLQKKLDHLMTHDRLTNLPNRILALDRLKQEINNSNRNRTQFGVIYVGLDRFKLINSKFESATSDKLLTIISQRLLSLVRSKDTVSRIAYDEFLLIITELDKVESLFSVCNKIIKTISTPIELPEHKFIITSSLGISIFSQKDITLSVNSLVTNADLAMYEAKSKGGNQYHFYTDKLDSIYKNRLESEESIRSAIENNEFILFYQPLYRIDPLLIIGAEALIRWQHPTRGMLKPIDFIPLAEDSGLILGMGEWILTEACKQAKSWQDAGFKEFRIAVNISMKQLRQTDFITMVAHILDKTALKPEYLEIEITENVLFNTPDIIESILALKKIGVSISLDDFGTGNSSLTNLKHIPLDCLKIDKSFVDDIIINKTNQAIVKSIIAIASALNIEVIAEGVETQEQFDFLTAVHCKEFQGYYFSEDITAADITVLLKKQNHAL